MTRTLLFTIALLLIFIFRDFYGVNSGLHQLGIICLVTYLVIAALGTILGFLALMWIYDSKTPDDDIFRFSYNNRDMLNNKHWRTELRFIRSMGWVVAIALQPGILWIILASFILIDAFFDPFLIREINIGISKRTEKILEEKIMNS